MNIRQVKFFNIPVFLLVTFFFITLLACGKEDVQMFDCTGLTPTYTADIKAILDASCAKAGCHDTNTHENGMDLSNYAGARSASHSDSFLGSIQHKSGYKPMPDDGPKLSNDKVEKLSCWVQNGSPE